MIVVILAVALSLMVVAVTFLAARGILPLNGFIGIRTRAVMRTEATWKAGHSSALPLTAGTSLATCIAAGVVLLVSPAERLEETGLVATGVFVLGLLGAALVANRAAKVSM